MKIIMKQTVDYILVLANQKDKQALDKIEFLKKNIVREEEKFFILKDE